MSSSSTTRKRTSEFFPPAFKKAKVEGNVMSAAGELIDNDASSGACSTTFGGEAKFRPESDEHFDNDDCEEYDLESEIDPDDFDDNYGEEVDVRSTGTAVGKVARFSPDTLHATHVAPQSDRSRLGGRPIDYDQLRAVCYHVDPITGEACDTCFSQAGWLKKHISGCHPGLKWDRQLIKWEKRTKEQVDVLRAKATKDISLLSPQELRKERQAEKERQKQKRMYARDSKIKVYVCSFCGFISKNNSSSNSKRHVMRMHLREGMDHAGQEWDETMHKQRLWNDILQEDPDAASQPKPKPRQKTMDYLKPGNEPNIHSKKPEQEHAKSLGPTIRPEMSNQEAKSKFMKMFEQSKGMYTTKMFEPIQEAQDE